MFSSSTLNICIPLVYLCPGNPPLYRPPDPPAGPAALMLRSLVSIYVYKIHTHVMYDAPPDTTVPVPRQAHHRSTLATYMSFKTDTPFFVFVVFGRHIVNKYMCW